LPVNVLPALVVVTVPYRKPPLVSSATFAMPVFFPVIVIHVVEPDGLARAADVGFLQASGRADEPDRAFRHAVNFSVCQAPCALATAGITSAPVVPRTTAAPAATMDLRSFMIPLLPTGHSLFRGMMRLRAR
jgi:hypothetical protein